MGGEKEGSVKGARAARGGLPAIRCTQVPMGGARVPRGDLPQERGRRGATCRRSEGDKGMQAVRTKVTGEDRSLSPLCQKMLG